MYHYFSVPASDSNTYIIHSWSGLVVPDYTVLHQFDVLRCDAVSAWPNADIVWRRPGLNDLHDSNLLLENDHGNVLQYISCEAKNMINNTEYTGFRNVSVYVQGNCKYL